jgi:hypothetical protein
MTDDFQAALQALIDTLNEYLEEEEDSAGRPGEVEAINADHPIHVAVVNLQKLLPNRKLPTTYGIRHLWHELLGRSRNHAPAAFRFANELLEALEEAYRVPKDQPRLRLDPQTQIAALAGKDYLIDNPKAFQLYTIIADKSGEPITRAGIRRLHPDFRGDKTIPTLLATLPDPIRATVKSGPAGYWLRLPPLPRSPHTTQT